jgi:alpha-galactosidase
VLDARGTAVPTIIHWGSDLGDLTQTGLAALADSRRPAFGPSSVDMGLLVSMLPLLTAGWSGQQGLDGFHQTGLAGAPLRRPSLHLVSVTTTWPGTVRVVLADAVGLTLEIALELTPEGILRQRCTLQNTGESDYFLTHLAAAVIPLPERASERLDFSGNWSHERTPQRAAIQQGTWLRESRHGRNGHDDAFLSLVGAPGFGFRHGEVWAFHLATSGDKRVAIDSQATGQRVIALGELLSPGEIYLAPGESYTSPWAMSAHSTEGMDGVSRRFHAYFRALPSHPETVRPLMLNTWEAVYFDHDLSHLIDLARRAADVGVERFVLDDGWMTGRTDDSRALGDWILDTGKWPDGLSPLIDVVNELGMDFGLWVEPEMISLDSTLAREHPDWVLADSMPGIPLSWRNQQVLDLANPEAFLHILTALSRILDSHRIAYLKWDMNRDLLGGSVHRQVQATYRLMDELLARYPALEIESCSSGGARIDAAVLERTHRVWPSDTNDPLERQAIHRYTSLLVPPEYLGAHIGAGRAHTTGRSHSLSFRLATAFFGHAGFEWDLTEASPEEYEALTIFAARFKAFRGLLHSGDVVRADSTDDARWLHGVVSKDLREAVFASVSLSTSPVAVPGPLVFPGLEVNASYRVSVLDLGAAPEMQHGSPPPWLASSDPVFPGSLLTTIGLPMPLLKPEQAIVLHLIVE